MIEISRRLSMGRSSGEPEGLDPSLRSRILSSVRYSDAEVSVFRPSHSPKFRRGFSLMVFGGAAAAGLALVVFMQGPQYRSSPKDIQPSASTYMPKKELSESQNHKSSGGRAGFSAGAANSPADKPVSMSESVSSPAASAPMQQDGLQYKHARRESQTVLPETRAADNGLMDLKTRSGSSAFSSGRASGHQIPIDAPANPIANDAATAKPSATPPLIVNEKPRAAPMKRRPLDRAKATAKSSAPSHARAKTNASGGASRSGPAAPKSK